LNPAHRRWTAKDRRPALCGVAGLFFHVPIPSQYTMFQLTQTPTFKATVKVNVSTPTGWREESFVGIFRRTDETQREDLLALKFVDLLREVLCGWEMVDEHRAPVEYTPENLEAFLRLTGAVRETANAYWKHNVGAKEKN
jgi:hypothetical protein